MLLRLPGGHILLRTVVIIMKGAMSNDTHSNWKVVSFTPNTPVGAHGPPIVLRG